MGDRTFSAEDVIRIYRDFLTEDEMKTVEEFFMEEELVVDLSFLESLLERLTLLALRLSGIPLSLILSIFGDLAQTTLREAVRSLKDTNEILGNIVEQGRVDA